VAAVTVIAVEEEEEEEEEEEDEGEKEKRGKRWKLLKLKKVKSDNFFWPAFYFFVCHASLFPTNHKQQNHNGYSR